MVSRKKCKNIALSIFMPFFNIIQALFWFLICLDNARVIIPLYERAAGRNPNAEYEPIMKTLEAKLSCDFKWSIADNIAAKLSCPEIPTLVPIITINVCLIIFTLMPKSSLEYWKLVEVDLTYVVYLSMMTVSSLHLIIKKSNDWNDFSLL